MHSVTASAPGKINIFFAVGSLLPDKYHDVASVYFALNLRERVTVSAADAWFVSVSGKISAKQIADVPTGSENLVVKIAKQLAEVSTVSDLLPLQFSIDKNVPVSGGMGGGSADAAAAILAADEFWQTQIDGEKLFDVAAHTGADIPFALIGGAAVGVGRGQKLTSIDSVKKFHWVLVLNDVGLSTPEVYAGLDQLREGRGEDSRNQPKPQVPEQLVEALQTGDAVALAKHLRNDLQEVAVGMRPELQETIDAGLAAGALAAMVSGSGPTVALLVDSAEAATSLANNMAIGGHLAVPTWGPASGTILENI